MRRLDPSLALGLCLLLGLGCYAAVYRTPALAPLGPLRNLLATLAATLPLLLTAHTTERITAPDRRQVALLFAGVVLLRLCIPLDLLAGSDDAYRYLWDGLVQSHGINPYQYPPQAGALAELRDAHFFAHIFRPDMRTVYPPLAQLWFALAYRLSPDGFAGLKLVLLLHDCATTYLLLRLARRLGAPPLRAALYAWSPLAVVQLFAGAHLDGLLLPWLLLALLWADRRPALAGVALAAATMVRPLAALCAPALVARRPLREGALAAIGFVLSAAALAAIFADAGATAMLESLRTYSEHWSFNGSLFRWPEAYYKGEDWFRSAVFATIAGGGVVLAWLPVSRRTRFAAALALYFALAPTVYPWYLLALVALLALDGGPLPLLLPALVTLSDLVFVDGSAGGQWTVPPGALWVEYVGLYGLALFEIWRRRRHAAAR